MSAGPDYQIYQTPISFSRQFLQLNNSFKGMSKGCFVVVVITAHRQNLIYQIEPDKSKNQIYQTLILLGSYSDLTRILFGSYSDLTRIRQLLSWPIILPKKIHWWITWIHWYIVNMNTLIQFKRKILTFARPDVSINLFPWSTCVVISSPWPTILPYKRHWLPF